MRTLLVAVLLAVAAFAAVPSASAAAQPLPVCVPPGVGSLAVCAGTVNGDPCVWAWVGLSYHSVCVDDEGRDLIVCDNSHCVSARETAGSLIAQPDPVCVPPGVESFGVCAGFVNNDLCVWAWVGPTPAKVVCLDQLVGTSASASSPPLPIGCDGSGVCVALSTDNGVCAALGLGLQGAGACVDTDPLTVRVCTTAYTALYGYCPTDAVAIGTTLA